MCYSVYLSTNNQKDLTEYNTELVILNRIAKNDETHFTTLLKNPHKWYVGSKSGCSCTFRHLTSTELGFGKPVDWYKEEQDEIDATGELFRLIRKLLNGGYSADIISIWEGSDPENVIRMDIDLSQLDEFTFRLFENHQFIFFSSDKSENNTGSASEFP